MSRAAECTTDWRVFVVYGTNFWNMLITQIRSTFLKMTLDESLEDVDIKLQEKARVNVAGLSNALPSVMGMHVDLKIVDCLLFFYF